MWKIIIKDICNILLLSLIQTYKYELTLMVGRNPSRISGSANSFGIRVCGLTLKGQVGMLPGENRGVDTAYGFW